MKKIFNTVIVLVFLFIVFYNENVSAKTYNFSSNYVSKYNIIYLEMDKAFDNIKTVYGVKSDSELLNIFSKLFISQKRASGNCKGKAVNYAYRVSTSDKVKLNNKTSIYVPDRYYVCDGEGNNRDIDDGVTVEIEKINGKYYLPAYFFSSIPGIKVNADGKTLYQSSSYYDSATILKSGSSHTIKMEISKVTDYSSLVKSVGKYHYYGEEDGALWREEAKKRIEKYRRGDITVTVKDTNGNVVNNATVKIQMLDNDFKFGTAINEVKGFSDISRTYFNGAVSTNLFKMRKYYANNITNDRKNFIKGATNLKLDYLRGHTLVWDILYRYTYNNIVGTKKDTNENNITMGFIKNKYDSFNKDGKYTSEEKTKINNWIKTLKTKYKNLIYDYIKKMVKDYPEFDEWDLLNEINSQEFFKYGLFYEEFLTDSKFPYDFVESDDARNKKRHMLSEYNTKEKFTAKLQEKNYSEYIDFLIGCIDAYRSVTKKTMVINEALFNGKRADTNTSDAQCIWMFEEINRRLKAKGKPIIDALGFQNHVRAHYYYTPNAYYNNYNYILKATGVKVGKITEYDTNVTDEASIGSTERKLRARYLSDSLIAGYSNQKINLFYIWSYNSVNVYDEERAAYRNTVKDWLNYTGNFTTSGGKVSTRVYTGEYQITVTANGKTTTKKINISNSSNSVEIKVAATTASNRQTNSTSLKGDVDGNGKVGSSDYLLVKKHILGISKLTGDKLTRANVDGKNGVTASDYLAIKKIILGK